jgi:hypothetical protein
VGRFLAQLARVRSGEASEIDTAGITAKWLERARWRLLRDGRLRPARQPKLGQALLDLPGGTRWQRAVAELWHRPEESSIQGLKQLALADGAAPASLRKAYEWLAACPAPKARRAAVEMADRLASSVPVGDPAWYRAKLNGISLLADLGATAEAAKRARYVLLVRPPGDPGLRERFADFAEAGTDR